MQFDLKENEIIEEIQKKNYKRIVLQFPEGLIYQGVELQRSLEKKLPE